MYVCMYVCMWHYQIRVAGFYGSQRVQHVLQDVHGLYGGGECEVLVLVVLVVHRLAIQKQLPLHALLHHIYTYMQ